MEASKLATLKKSLRDEEFANEKEKFFKPAEEFIHKTSARMEMRLVHNKIKAIVIDEDEHQGADFVSGCRLNRPLEESIG